MISLIKGLAKLVIFFALFWFVVGASFCQHIKKEVRKAEAQAALVDKTQPPRGGWVKIFSFESGKSLLIDIGTKTPDRHPLFDISCLGNQEVRYRNFVIPEGGIVKDIVLTREYVEKPGQNINVVKEPIHFIEISLVNPVPGQTVAVKVKCLSQEPRLIAQ